MLDFRLKNVCIPKISRYKSHQKIWKTFSSYLYCQKPFLWSEYNSQLFKSKPQQNQILIKIIFQILYCQEKNFNKPKQVRLFLQNEIIKFIDSRFQNLETMDVFKLLPFLFFNSSESNHFNLAQFYPNFGFQFQILTEMRNFLSHPRSV